MILTIHTSYVNTAYSLLSFGTVYRLLWWCSSFTKYSHTKLWHFLPDNSFTRLILLYNVSQSMESNSHSLPPSSYFARHWGLPLTHLSALPFIWQTNFLSSLLLAVNLPLLSVCDCVSVCVCMSLFVSVSASQPLRNILLLSSCFSCWHLLSCPLPLLPSCLLVFSISSLRSVLHAESWTTVIILHGHVCVCCMSVIIPN